MVPGFGANLEDSLRPHSVWHQYSQAAKPWRKSGIEKLFDQMNKGLVNALHRKTFYVYSTELQPKKDAVVGGLPCFLSCFISDGLSAIAAIFSI